MMSLTGSTVSLKPSQPVKFVTKTKVFNKKRYTDSIDEESKISSYQSKFDQKSMMSLTQSTQNFHRHHVPKNLEDKEIYPYQKYIQNKMKKQPTTQSQKLEKVIENIRKQNGFINGEQNQNIQEQQKQSVVGDVIKIVQDKEECIENINDAENVTQQQQLVQFGLNDQKFEEIFQKYKCQTKQQKLNFIQENIPYFSHIFQYCLCYTCNCGRCKCNFILGKENFLRPKFKGVINKSQYGQDYDQKSKDLDQELNFEQPVNPYNPVGLNYQTNNQLSYKFFNVEKKEKKPSKILYNDPIYSLTNNKMNYIDWKNPPQSGAIPQLASNQLRNLQGRYVTCNQDVHKDLGKADVIILQTEKPSPFAAVLPFQENRKSHNDIMTDKMPMIKQPGNTMFYPASKNGYLTTQHKSYGLKDKNQCYMEPKQAPNQSVAQKVWKRFDDLNSNF